MCQMCKPWASLGSGSSSRAPSLGPAPPKLAQGDERLASSSSNLISPLFPALLLAGSQLGNELKAQCLTLKNWCLHLSPPSGKPSPCRLLTGLREIQAQLRPTASWRQGQPDPPTHTRPGTCSFSPPPPLRKGTSSPSFGALSCLVRG